MSSGLAVFSRSRGLFKSTWIGALYSGACPNLHAAQRRSMKRRNPEGHRSRVILGPEQPRYSAASDSTTQKFGSPESYLIHSHLRVHAIMCSLGSWVQRKKRKFPCSKPLSAMDIQALSSTLERCDRSC